jgi:hypothetical protein
MDRILAKLHARIREMDRELRDLLQDQTDNEQDGGRKALHDAQQAIQVQIRNHPFDISGDRNYMQKSKASKTRLSMRKRRCKTLPRTSNPWIVRSAI